MSAHFFMLARSSPRGLGVLVPLSDSATAASRISATFFGIRDDAFHGPFSGSGVGDAAFASLGACVVVGDSVGLGEANGSVRLPEEMFAFSEVPEQAEKPTRNTVTRISLSLMVRLLA